MTAGAPAAGQPATLAAALRAGLYCAEAGVELLIGQGAWLRRGDFTGPFIVVTPGLAGRAAVAVIGWDAAITAAARAVLHAGGHQDATVTLPPAIPPHLRRKGER
jgi:hypothetical protein